MISKFLGTYRFRSNKNCFGGIFGNNNLSNMCYRPNNNYRFCWITTCKRNNGNANPVLLCLWRIFYASVLVNIRASVPRIVLLGNYAKLRASPGRKILGTRLESDLYCAAAGPRIAESSNYERLNFSSKRRKKTISFQPQIASVRENESSDST